MFGGAKATPAADCFAFGVVLWELLTWQVPWRGADFWEIVRSLVVGERLQIPAREALPGPDTQQARRRCRVAAAGVPPRLPALHHCNWR